MTFPLAKLGFLLMKQMCKPLANLIKNEAKQHEFFRKYFCIPPARAYHWMDMHLLNPQKYRDQTWPPMTEDEEVELGANLLGEFILFSLLSTVLIMELNRQGDKKALKEKTQKDEVTVLVETISALMHDVDEMKVAIRKIRKRLDIDADNLISVDEIKSQEQEDFSQFKNFWSIPKRKKIDFENDEIDGANPDPYSP